MDKIDDLTKLLQEAYGFSDEQLLEEFERIKSQMKPEDYEAGDVEALLERIKGQKKSIT